MRVDRADDRNGAHTLPHEREPVAVDVRHRFAHRGPVRRHEQAVERAGGIERRRQHRQERVEAVRFHRSVRQRPGGEDRHGLDARRLQAGEKAPHLVVGVGQRGPHSFSRCQQVRVKVIERGLSAEKRVRFLQEGHDTDAAAG